MIKPKTKAKPRTYKQALVRLIRPMKEKHILNLLNTLSECMHDGKVENYRYLGTAEEWRYVALYLQKKLELTAINLATIRTTIAATMLADSTMIQARDEMKEWMGRQKKIEHTDIFDQDGNIKDAWTL